MDVGAFAGPEIWTAVILTARAKLHLGSHISFDKYAVLVDSVLVLPHSTVKGSAFGVDEYKIFWRGGIILVVR
jgi:hypothetical protein